MKIHTATDGDSWCWGAKLDISPRALSSLIAGRRQVGSWSSPLGRYSFLSKRNQSVMSNCALADGKIQVDNHSFVCIEWAPRRVFVWNSLTCVESVVTKWNQCTQSHFFKRFHFSVYHARRLEHEKMIYLDFMHFVVARLASSCRWNHWELMKGAKGPSRLPFTYWGEGKLLERAFRFSSAQFESNFDMSCNEISFLLLRYVNDAPWGNTSEANVWFECTTATLLAGEPQWETRDGQGRTVWRLTW